MNRLSKFDAEWPKLPPGYVYVPLPQLHGYECECESCRNCETPPEQTCELTTLFDLPPGLWLVAAVLFGVAWVVVAAR